MKKKIRKLCIHNLSYIYTQFNSLVLYSSLIIKFALSIVFALSLSLTVKKIKKILLICPAVAEWREQTIYSTCILTARTQSSLNYLLISKGTISSFRMATYKKLAQQQQQSCTKKLQYGTRGLDSS